MSGASSKTFASLGAYTITVSFLVCFGFPGHASAQANTGLEAACGLAPGNLQYSHDFVSSVQTAACDVSSRDSSGNLGVDVFGIVGVSLGGSSNVAQNSCSSSANKTEDATKIIQNEYKNNQANVLSLCTYGACRTQYLAHHPGDTNSQLLDRMAMETVSDVCHVAISNSALPGVIRNSITAAPNSPQHIFKKGETSATYYATLFSNDDGDLRINIPAPQDYVRVISPRPFLFWHSFSLPAHGQRVIEFELTKPAESDTITSRDVVFSVGSDNQATATFSFNLIPSAAILENPASIPCGQVNPNLMAEAYRDDRSSDRYTDPGSLSQKQTFVAVQDGPYHSADGSGFEADDNFYANGGGAAKATLSTDCDRVVQGQRTQALTIVKLHETLWAQNATNHDSCGSGFGPGGEAASNPDWRTTLSLPGGRRAYWTVSVTPSLSTQFKNRSCAISLDGQALSGAPVVTNAGSHLLDAACVSNTGTADHFPILGDRGGCGTHVSEDEEYDLVVHATRQ